MPVAGPSPGLFSPDALLNTLLDISLTGVILFRPVYAPEPPKLITDLAYVHLNKVAQHMLQLPERPAQTFLSLYPHAAETGIFAFYRDTFLAGTPNRYDINYQHDGLDNFFQLSAQRSGEVLVVSFNDTADQDRSAVELALRESQWAERTARAAAETQRRRFYEVLQHLPAQVAAYHGPGHVYEFVNALYQSRFPTQNLLGRSVQVVMAEEADQDVIRWLDQVYQTGVPFHAQEQEVWVDWTGTGRREQAFLNIFIHPLRNAQGQVDGLLNFTSDVTEQIRARQQVEQLNHELESRVQERTRELGDSNLQLTRTNADLDNFVYTASHDLKAPISNIEGLLASLREELPPQAPGSTMTYILDLMQDSVERFTHTIALLTDVSKLQHEYSQQATPVPLAAVIEDVRQDLAPLLQQVGGQLRVHVAATPTIAFAEKNLRSVIYNLVSNGLKYHDPARPAVVHIRSRVEAPYCVLEVRDNGLGLDLEHEHQLFTMFRRFHTHVEGSGVGLYMVKKMVENAGGKIEVISQLGQGSTFSVYLPI